MLQIKALKEKSAFQIFNQKNDQVDGSWWEKKNEMDKEQLNKKGELKVNGALIMSKVNLNTQMTIRVIKQDKVDG